MTTKTILSVLGLMLFTSTAFSQKYWKLYKPASTDILGYSADYNKSTKELMTVKKYPVKIVTKTGASSDFENFSKNANVDIIGFSYDRLKISKITAKGQIFIDQVEEADLIPEDLFFIYAGLRSDSVEVEFEKTSNLDIKPEELLTAINTVGVKIDPKWLGINFVDTLKFKSTGKVTMTIKNPNVYYSLQFVKLDRTTKWAIKESWSLTFNQGSVNNQIPITLKPISGQFKSRDDLVTKRYWFQKNPNPTKVWLEVDKDNNGVTQLYVRTSRDAVGYKGYLLKPNALGNTEWSIRGETAKAFEQYGTGVYKILKIDIDAKRTADGGIEITHSLLKYPEGRLKPQ